MQRTILTAGSLVMGIFIGINMAPHGSLAAVPCVSKPNPSHHTAPRPHPTKHASAAPKYVLDVSGSSDKQTNTFRVSGQFSIGWNAQLQDSSIGQLAFGIEIDNADGSMVDVIGPMMNSTRDVSVEHADCSKGCYLKITASNANYRIVVGN